MLIRSILILALLALAGCHRQRAKVLLPGVDFRIVTPSPDQNVVLAPPVIQAYDRSPVTFTLPVATRKTGCNVDVDPFHVRLEKNRAILQLNSAAEWEKFLTEWDQPGNKEVEARGNAMLSAFELLARRGCIKESSAAQIRQMLRESLPMRQQESLYPAYGYRAGGGALDLRTGLQLQVVRAYFNKPPEQRRSAIDGYIGLVTSSYDCVEDDKGRVTVRRSDVKFAPESIRAEVREIDNLKLPPRPLYRFLMHVAFLRSGVKRVAVLLGTESLDAMKTLETKLAADPTRPCADLIAGTAKAVCVPFEGDVTVSPQVRVTVNGQPRYVPWGTTVQVLLREVKEASNVQLRRMWGGALRMVRVEDQGLLLRTVLVGGDDVRWSVP